MIWVLLAIAAVSVLALMYELNRATTEKFMLQNRLAMSEHYRRQDAKAFAKALEQERALNKAAAEWEAGLAVDMEACEQEMDRLEVEELLAELDEENFN